MSTRVPILAPEPDHPDRESLRRLGLKVRRSLAADKRVRRIAVDQAELWAVADFLDATECARLMAQIDLVAEPSTTYGVPVERDFRTSYSGLLDPADPFVRKLRRRFDRLLGIDGAHGEMLEGQRYTVGQQFKPHSDWFQARSPGWAHERDNGGQRAFTAMAYLNTVESGGETDFPRLDIAVAPRAGTLLVWNNADRDGVPNPFTVHAGNPVLHGTKYVLTRWYRVRPTRSSLD